MSRASRLKALRDPEVKDARRKFKQLFHGKDPAHFALFGKGEVKTAQTHYGRLTKDFDKHIAEANAGGLSVCMSINSSRKGKREKANFLKVNAVFIDKDEGELTVKDLRALPLKPHLIVRSSKNKFHAYWLVDDCPIWAFSAVQKALAQMFGTDLSVSDIGRVMRLAGTLNSKYPDAPPVKIVYMAKNPKPLKLRKLIGGLGLKLDVAVLEQLESEWANAPTEEFEPPVPSLALAPNLDTVVGQGKIEQERILAALAVIPADDRQTWLCVGMALHHWDASDAGYTVWDAWSRTSTKHDADIQRSTWDAFKPKGGVTLGSLFYLAKLEQEQVPDEKLSFDESSLAEQFCQLYADTLRYDPKAGQWFAFDGTIWEPGSHRPQMAAREMVATLKLARGGGLADRLRSFGTATGLKAIVKHAELLSGMHIDAGTFDSKPDLLAVKYGVVNLRTGHWRAATPADGMSFRSPVAYDPTASCPIWDTFIRGVVRDDEEFARYLQRVLGYSLFGHAKEQVFFLVIGPGGNGKGVLMRTIKAVLDQYAHAIAPNVLSRAYSGNPNSPSPALAPLQRARFVACTELPVGGLDEAFVKQFAGGDQLSARPTYGDLVTFTPPGKLWLSTNTMPQIEAGHLAMWRRLVPLPFEANFRGKKADPDLEAKLEKEHAGILAWLLRGAATYARDGLGECKAVNDCRKALKASADSVQAWLNECCRVDAGARVAAGEAFASYVQYTRGAKRKPLSNKEFPPRVEKKGFAHKRRSEGNYFFGLRLLDSHAKGGYR
ncbi:P4 family phage/plasmid primase-like protein [Variovorax boronicumulans]|uniref:phage/plasmid primase, P4 family n=1 Tax=Variovorax boronicumulans TaxID=436515 RepID=UPI002780DFA6|nr:phage/plasmid primase, P4 family [Variovorax boronicumulans]MDQ0017832.1 P4 family phage/plasmid primase-like protein [Variovorax boronicumulans]